MFCEIFWILKTMLVKHNLQELVTTAFKIALDERYKDLKTKKSQAQEIIDEFTLSCKANNLLECYNVFSNIIVTSWLDVGEEIAGRIFDLLFREWDLTSKIIIPTQVKKAKNDYYFSPEEDFWE